MKRAYSIFGPPGTGKSTEVIRRFKSLLDAGVPQDRIGLVSFTKAAAKELASRIGVESHNIATIHSFCYRLSGISQSQVVGWQDLRKFSESCGIEIRGDNPDETEELCEGDHYLSMYGLAHAKMQSYDDIWDTKPAAEGTRERFIYFAKSYDNWKNAHGFVDFSDMLGAALDVPPPDLDVLFIDEAQDLSPLQWEVIRHWARVIDTVTIAGDDDQAIYVWGGADPHGMRQFEREYDAERTILGQSYRVPVLAHKLAENLISTVSSRVDKEYKPRDSRGIIKKHTIVHSVKLEHGEDALVLYRSHYVRKEIEDMLIARGIPYIVDSGKQGVLQSPLARAIRAFKAFRGRCEDHETVVGLTDTERRLFKTWLQPSTNGMIERGEYSRLMAGEWKRHVKVTGAWGVYLTKIERSYGLDVKPTIHLSTIHGSKGRQAERVVLINQVSDNIDTAMQTTDGYDDEIRTFYVAVTRTMNRLDIVNGDNAIPIIARA